MFKFVVFAVLVIAAPLRAQNCDVLCNPESYSSGDLAIIETAILAGETISVVPIVDSNPVILAASLGTPEILSALLRAGANPNTVTPRICRRLC